MEVSSPGKRRNDRDFPVYRLETIRVHSRQFHEKREKIACFPAGILKVPGLPARLKKESGFYDRNNIFLLKFYMYHGPKK